MDMHGMPLKTPKQRTEHGTIVFSIFLHRKNKNELNYFREIHEKQRINHKSYYFWVDLP